MKALKTFPQWGKSSRSGPNCDNCVETSVIGPVIGVRDSKDAAGPHLTVSPEAFRGFVAGVRSGAIAA